MALEELLARLGQQVGDTPDTGETAAGVADIPAPNLDCTLDTPDTPLIDAAANNLQKGNVGISQAKFHVPSPPTAACPIKPLLRAQRPAMEPLTPYQEKTIREWFTHIEETNPGVIGEVLVMCSTDESACNEYFDRALKILGEDWPTPRCVVVTCASCRHFRRIDHPHLGHCAAGEPEAIAGLWDTGLRGCTRWLRLLPNSGDEAHGE